MKGLLIKDCFVLWKQMKIMLFLIAAYTVAAAFRPENRFWMTFAVIFMFNLVYTAIALDERSHWDRYSVMLPCSKKEIVLEKYILGMAGMAGSAFLYGILLYTVQRIKGYGLPITEIVPFVLMTIAMSGVLLGINMPLTFKEGVEKSRMWSILLSGVIFVAFIIFTSAMETGEGIELFGIKTGGFSVSAVQVYAVFAGSILLLIGSVRMSVRIYEKKEL